MRKSKRVSSVIVTAQLLGADGAVLRDLGVIGRYQRARAHVWCALAAACAVLAVFAPHLLGLLAPLGLTMLVNTGKAICANLMGDLAGTVPQYLAWGTGAGTTNITDIDLFTEVDTRTTGTVTRTTTVTTNDSFTVIGAITAGANRTITNAGLFDAISSGILFVKTDFTPVVVLSGNSLAFQFNVNFT